MEKETRSVILTTLTKSGELKKSYKIVEDDYERNMKLIALWAVGRHKKLKGVCSKGNVYRPDGKEDKSYSFTMTWSAEDEKE